MIGVLTSEEKRVNILPARPMENALGQVILTENAIEPDLNLLPLCLYDR